MKMFPVNKNADVISPVILNETLFHWMVFDTFPISYMYSETRMVLKIHKHKARITPTIVYLHVIIAFQN